jgi:hypothetical protein
VDLSADHPAVSQCGLELAEPATVHPRRGLHGRAVPDAGDALCDVVAEADRARGAVGVDEVKQLVGFADARFGVGRGGAGVLQRAGTATALARQRELALGPSAAAGQPAAAAQLVEQLADAGARGLPRQLAGDRLVGERGVAVAVLAPQ